MFTRGRISLLIGVIIFKQTNCMEFFNTLASVGFVVGEEHTTTAKNEANTNNGENEHKLFDNSCGIDDGRGAKIVVIKPQTKNNVVSVYPNPANNYINVLVVDMQQAVLTDILGNALQVGKAKGNLTTFNTQNLLPGLYFVKITDSKGNVKTEKFVKD